jgi:hypothetical protein
MQGGLESKVLSDKIDRVMKVPWLAPCSLILAAAVAAILDSIRVRLVTIREGLLGWAAQGADTAEIALARVDHLLALVSTVGPISFLVTLALLVLTLACSGLPKLVRFGVPALTLAAVAWTMRTV